MTRPDEDRHEPRDDVKFWDGDRDQVGLFPLEDVAVFHQVVAIAERVLENDIEKDPGDDGNPEKAVADCLVYDFHMRKLSVYCNL